MLKPEEYFLPLDMSARLAFEAQAPSSTFGRDAWARFSQNRRALFGLILLTAVVLLAFLMMIVRRKAVAQVVGFLAMENGLLFAATSATQGMPMVVELGIGLDVLVGVFILGIFFFQIREQFDSLDLQNMESLKED